VPGKDEWIPEPENSGADNDDDTDGDTEGYGETTPAATPRAYKSACKMLPWAELFPDPKYRIGVPGANWQELLYDVDLAPVWKALDELNRDNRFRFFPIMARYSKASVYKLQASSFCERVNSAGKIVFSDSNLSLASEKVEQRTMLRMNKKWMAHMRKHYPDCTADLMVMLRQSHEAIAPLSPEANVDDLL
jgi:hypothetical protein